MPVLRTVQHLLIRCPYAGIGTMMFIADLVFFVPSEVITPMVGYVAATQGLSFFGTMLAATAGSVLGGVPWYFAGQLLQRRGLDRWLSGHRALFGIPSNTIQKAEDWFRRHGGLAVLMARLLPGIRPLIGVPAGSAGFSFSIFLLYSTLGTLAWTTGLTAAGWFLKEEYQRAGDAVVVFGIVIGTTVGAGYGLWLLLRHRHQGSRESWPTHGRDRAHHPAY